MSSVLYLKTDKYHEITKADFIGLKSILINFIQYRTMDV